MTQTTSFDPVLRIPERKSTKPALKSSSSGSLSLSGMRKSLSFGSAKLGNSNSFSGSNSNSNSSSGNLRRNVSFGSGSVRLVDTVEEDQKNAVWYSKRELSSLRKHEVQQTTTFSLQQQQQQQLLALAAHNKANKKNKDRHNNHDNVYPRLEHANLTWRGMEDVQLGYNRVEKSQKYVSAVLNEIDMQQQAGYFNEYELRAVAKTLSRQERGKAHKMALLDEKEALEKKEQKKNKLLALLRA